MTVKALHRQVGDKSNRYNLMSYIMGCHINFYWNNFHGGLKTDFI